MSNNPSPTAVAVLARIHQWFLKFDPETADADFWSVQLEGITFIDAITAVDRLAHSQPAFPPEIGEVVATARALMAPPRPTLGDVRLEITNAIREVGGPPVGCSSTYQEPAFSETTFAVVAKMGGWGRVSDKPAEGTQAVRNWDFSLSRAYTDVGTVQSPVIEGGKVPDGLAAQFNLNIGNGRGAQ